MSAVGLHPSRIPLLERTVALVATGNIRRDEHRRRGLTSLQPLRHPQAEQLRDGGRGDRADRSIDSPAATVRVESPYVARLSITTSARSAPAWLNGGCTFAWTGPVTSSARTSWGLPRPTAI